MSKKSIISHLNKLGFSSFEIEWQPISYPPQGREGGWYIDLNVNTDYEMDVIDKAMVNSSIIYEVNGNVGAIYMDGGFINGYNAKSVLKLIKSLPNLNDEELYGDKCYRHLSDIEYEQF